MSQIDNILIQVRAKLKDNNIKLWLEPYYFSGIGAHDDEIDKLAAEYSQSLNFSLMQCRAALNELQDGAVEKLKSRAEYQKTGLASIKIRAVLHENETRNTRIINLQTSLNITGREFLNKVAQTLYVDSGILKLISSGKNVDPEKLLSEQGIVNNQQMMVLAISGPDSGEQNDVQMYDRVYKAKKDAELLIKSQESYFKMEDQDGNAVHLPPNEKKSILMALALTEKGRSALKREKYSEALVLFLEADQEFSTCTSKILESVDNYALLNLDIVWCYLCLKSVTQLPDAQRRLQICEENFNRSYGVNMDRVIALKGSSQNEKALVMRLHLLQAVLLYHQNCRTEANGLLMLAESELRGLKINEGSLTNLVEMGYNPAEARIALRSCGGDVESAITFIIDRREKKIEARRRAAKEHAISKPKTFEIISENDGKWVNPRSLNNLIEMGFSKPLAKAALKKAENDLNLAVHLLHNNVAELMSEIPKDENKQIHDNALEQILNTSLNLDPDIAKEVIKFAINDPDMARNIVTAIQSGNMNEFVTNLVNNMSTFNDRNEAGPSTSSKPRDPNSNVMKEHYKTEFEAAEAYDRFSKDFDIEDDDYLDLTLDREENILVEYKNYLNN